MRVQMRLNMKQEKWKQNKIRKLMMTIKAQGLTLCKLIKGMNALALGFGGAAKHQKIQGTRPGKKTRGNFR